MPVTQPALRVTAICLRLITSVKCKRGESNGIWNYNYNDNEIYIYDRHIRKRVRLFFHTFLYYQHPFSTFLCEMLYAGHVKLFAESSEFLHARSVSARRRRRRPRNGVLGVHPSGGRKDASRTVLNRGCREDDAEHFHPIVAFASSVRRLACGLALSCRRTWLNFVFGQTLLIRRFYFFESLHMSRSYWIRPSTLSLVSLPWLVDSSGGCRQWSFHRYWKCWPSVWVNTCGIFTMYSSQLSINFYRTGAFLSKKASHQSLPCTYVCTATMSSLCDWLEHRWPCWVIQCRCPVGKTRNSNRLTLKGKNRAHCFRTDHHIASCFKLLKTKLLVTFLFSASRFPKELWF